MKQIMYCSSGELFIGWFQVYIEAIGSSGPRRDIGLDDVVIAECSYLSMYLTSQGFCVMSQIQ